MCSGSLWKAFQMALTGAVKSPCLPCAHCLTSAKGTGPGSADSPRPSVTGQED